MNNKYVLIFGLSADPIHQAHSDLVVNVTKALIARGYFVTRVMIIPVYRRNPVGSKHKEDLPDTFDHRFAMCELAAQEMRQRLAEQVRSIVVSRIEEKLAGLTLGPNYTVETLTALRDEEDPNTRFIFPLSSDHISGDEPELGSWYQLEKLIQLTIIAICPRTGYQRNDAFLKSLKHNGAQLVYLDELNTKDITSSRIRERLINHEDPLDLCKEGLLQKSVAFYIKQYGIYN